MAGITEDRTLLPEHRAEIAELRAFLDAAPEAAEPAVLWGPDGTAKALPAEVYEALLVVVRALSEGKAVTVAPVHTTLTTQEAADLLGVSRPTLVKILDRGELSYSRPGRHRRVLLADLIEFREQRRAKRRSGLDELVDLTEEAGLYDD
ncbi:helix-turn-helix domain-containing protein [Streptomyces sp. NBC_00091]|uniref:helix-turn-helix domain-containing protein n=1 Tax=Streptomyces sp. NBC_00091 TaxID=2975648 RepID=UPI0022578AFF|nr:helix-turn-helix domain-containing protein [Streptomyces sp. NBC_00091]MCX5376951.1 helix-turn-helix domain-containing protein [Streptomyces sp. NBC_00091]